MSAFMVNWLSTTLPRQVNGERIILSANDDKSTDIRMQTNETEPWPHTTYKVEMNQRLKLIY